MAETQDHDLTQAIDYVKRVAEREKGSKHGAQYRQLGKYLNILEILRGVILNMAAEHIPSVSDEEAMDWDSIAGAWVVGKHVGRVEFARMLSTLGLLPSPEAPIDKTELTAKDFYEWVGSAKRGDTLEYHRGFLYFDRGPQPVRDKPVIKTPEQERVDRLAECAMGFSDQHVVYLVQRRLDRSRFSYLAVRA